MPASSAQEFAKLQSLTPQEAVDYLQRRNRLTQTFSWQDLWHDEHAQQFTVSRLARLDLLKAIQDGITKSVQGDLTRRDWMSDTKALLQKEGWWGQKDVLDPVSGDVVSTKFDSPRLKLIFDTNTRMANSAGLWDRVWRNRETHPYVRYITRGDERVRESHRAWANLTLPADHPFWETHWPPNGWRCRCRVMSMTQAEYDRRLGAGEISIEEPPEQFITWTNQRTGVVSQVPIGVSPGFDYNPGLAQARFNQLQSVADAKVSALPPSLAQAARQNGLFASTSGAGDVPIITPRPKLDGDAKAWVVGQGKITNTEHAVIYDANTGREIGRSSSVERERVMIPARAAALLDDRSVALVIHHNHPDSLSLSAVDLGLLTRDGVVRVTAHGHDGATFSATRGQNISLLTAMQMVAKKESRRQFAEAAMRGLNLTGLEAHLINLALHQLEAISYSFSLDVQRLESYTADAVAFDRIISEISNALNFIRRK